MYMYNIHIHFICIDNLYGFSISSSWLGIENFTSQVDRGADVDCHKLPNILAQSRAIISGRSKKDMAWWLIYTDGGGGKWREKRGREDRWLCVFYKTNVGLGLKIWGGYNE